MTPRLSVVVPFYNVGDYIGDCLDSIARQSYRDFEAILVDDGSSDHSTTVARRRCRQDPRFRVVTQDNQGLGPARNTGVRAARGEYLAFVDSDDLVTRHGFERLIHSLDRTGSCFAGGDARRFSNSSGVRPSWIHRIPFARDRIATHVLETPDLVLDRMVWNKVYRRSFWDQHGYEFPAIRYEDYPVTLKAHLDAGTVDALSVPVYYWRERESGESITQQRFELANLADRVRSAEQVLDLVASGVPEVRRRVHAHLTQIDLLTLMTAFGSVPAEQDHELVRLARRLLDRLDDAALRTAHRYDQLQHQALRAGDVELLRRLAEYRLNGGLRGGARARVRPSRPWRLEQDYPGVRDRTVSVPQELYRLPVKSLTLATTVREVRWDNEDLVVRGTAEIRHLELRPSSHLRIALVAGRTEEPVEVRRFSTTNSHGGQSLVGFEFRLDRRLQGLLPAAGGAHFTVRLRSGLLHRSGRLRGQQPGSPTWPPGRWLTGTDWVQPGLGKDGGFVVRRLTDPSRLTGIGQSGDALVLSGRLAAEVPGAQLQLSRTLTGHHRLLPLRLAADRRHFSVRLPIEPIVTETEPDDPFSQRTTWAVEVLGTDEQRSLLLWTAPEQSVSRVVSGRQVSLTRSVGNYVNLHEAPARLAGDRAAARHGRWTVSGPSTDGGAAQAFTWRRHFENSDDHVDVPCRRTVSGGRWTAEVDAADLIPAYRTRLPGAADPLAPLANWSLFAIAADGSSYAVQCDPFLAGRLPVETRDDGCTAVLRPRSNTLHVEVS